MLGGLGAGLAVILMVVAWQLSSGPISLAFLTPYIENAINAGQPNFKLSLKDTILTWAGWDRTLDIRVLDVKVMRQDGSLVGNIPEVSFSVSGRALFGGQLAPKSVELFGPRLRVRREFDGSIDVGFMDAEAPASDFTERFLNQLLSAPVPGNAMSYLSRLEIVSAEVTLDDQLLGKSWVTPSANVSLVRDASGIRGSIGLYLDVDGRQTEFSVSGVYQTALKRFDLVADFSEVSPVAFSSMYYELGPLRAFALPLKGMVTAGVTLEGKVEWVGFDLAGGRGVLNLPDPVEQSLPVNRVVLKGRYEGAEDMIDIEELTLDLGLKGHFILPAADSHSLPLRNATLKGRFLGKTQRLEIFEASADLQGPTVKLSAVVDGLPGFRGTGGGAGISVDLKGALHDVPVDQVEKYWPAAWGTSAHRWTFPHLSEGMLHQARAEVRLWSGEGGGFEVVSLDGDMEVSGVTVDYLPPMPPVRNTEAYMKFDEKNFNIYITKGSSENLTVSDGAILMTGLDEVDQYNDITLTINGTLPDQLAYLDHQPLGYASAIGIDPSKTKGEAETQLKLTFLMEEAMTLDTIKISSKSKATGVTAANAVLGRDIAGGTLDIRVDKKGMDLTGSVNIGKIPATLVWRENFGDKPKFKRRYDLKARIAHVGHIADLGLDVAPFTDKFVRGALDADIRLTQFNDTEKRLNIQADITNAEISAPAFGWSKKPGLPGVARITVDFDGENIRDVPEFLIAADDLKMSGRARYGPPGGNKAGAKAGAKGKGLYRIDFDQISFGRTDMRGAVIAHDLGGWDAGFHGPSFDMTSLWEDILQGSEDPGGDDFTLPYLTLAVELERVWIGPNRSLKNISGTFAHEDEIWKTVLVKGELGDRKSFELTIRPGADGNRNLLMTASDAGEALRVTDFYGSMQGGRLEITGKYDEAAPGQPLTGEIRVKDYRVTRAPALAHILSIMALTGIVEALEGDGLAFGTLSIPFVLGPGWMEIKNARVSGPSLGFTASGIVYTYADVVDVTGTVVPAYAINSALGHIPVLGEIFTGGEKGGGVFAANYTMSGTTNDPKVTVNPLSALTPGIFRNVFDIFGQADFSPQVEEDPSQQQEIR
jgi:hypothetical protein